MTTVFTFIAGISALLLIAAVVARRVLDALFSTLYPGLARDIAGLRDLQTRPCHIKNMRIDTDTARAIVQAATSVLEGVPAMKASIANLQTTASNLTSQLTAAQAALGDTDELRTALAAAQETIADLDRQDANLDTDITSLREVLDSLTPAPAPAPSGEEAPAEVPASEVPATDESSGGVPAFNG